MPNKPTANQLATSPATHIILYSLFSLRVCDEYFSENGIRNRRWVWCEASGMYGHTDVKEG